MKKLLLILSFFLTFFNSRGQNLPQCDSLVIQCCTFDSVAPNTLTIYVTNNSSYLFDYPNFVLFDPAMDTIAKETTTYFGIGTWPQPHTLNVTTQIALPFTGYLNLYTWFGDSLCCSWPFYIPDTVTGISSIESDLKFSFHPNPTNGDFMVSVSDVIHETQLSIHDLTGKVLLQQVLQSKSEFFQTNLSPGIYLLEISVNQSLLKREKLIIR